jgi:hypothetical protein
MRPDEVNLDADAAHRDDQDKFFMRRFEGSN